MKPKPDLTALEDHVRENDLDRADFPILDQRPTIFPDLRWVWEGFHSLSASRQRGFSSLQPLAMSEIVAYATFRGFNYEEKEEFLHYVQHLDVLFMKEMDERQPKPKK